MESAYKTKARLLEELELMRRKVHEIEVCQNEFQKIKEKHEKLLDSAPDAMVFINAEGRIVMVNAQFEKMFGYGHEEVIGKGIEILVPERFRKRHSEYVSKYFKQPRVRPMGSDVEIYAVNKKGDEFPVDISLSPLNTEEEALVTAAVRDITKRKDSEKQVELNYLIQKVINAMLKVSLEPLTLEEQCERILDLIISIPHFSLQSKGAIYFVEDDDGVLYLKAHRGFSESELMPCRKIPLGKCLCGRAAMQSEVVYANHVDHRHEIHAEEEFPHGHYCVPVLSGEKVLGLINVYVKEGHKRSNEEETFLTSVANNLAGIIKHHRSEHEKEHLQAQLAQSEKLAALGRFTANVAHEIRNPLTAIGGFARRLEKSISGETKEKEYAGFIISEVRRLEGILKNVLTYSRDVTPQLQEYDIGELIDRVIKMNEEVCREKSISIQKSYNHAHHILVDNVQLHEAVENLVLNAIESMPDGGTLTISTDKEMRGGIPYISIRIRDSGTGIPPAKLDLIFEPFYTTKVVNKGTGLGLSITKKVVEDHGGFMMVESKEGEGSVFALYFPYKPGPSGEDV